MANAVAVFDPSAMPALPADLQKFYEEESNITARETVPSLGYEGKVWSVSMNGSKQNLERKNADGDMEAIQIAKVIILDAAKERGRAYYPGTYDPKKVSMPKCWSRDGGAPDSNVKLEDRQAAVCNECPMSKKGSRQSDNGKSVTACSEHRMLAVQIYNKDLSYPPLRMKIAVTSDWDGQSPDLEAEGWFGFKNFLDYLRKKGVPHTAMIRTKMKFDPGAAYPKIKFGVDDWLTTEQIAKLTPTVKSTEVRDLITDTWTVNGRDGTRAIKGPDNNPQAASVDKVEDGPTPEELAAASAEKAAAEAAAQKAAEKTAKIAAAKAKAAAELAALEAEDDDGPVLAGVAEAPPKDPKPAPAAAAAPAMVVEDDEPVLTANTGTAAKPAGKAAGKKKDTPATTVAAAPADPAKADAELAALMGEWGG